MAPKASDARGTRTVAFLGRRTLARPPFPRSRGRPFLSSFSPPATLLPGSADVPVTSLTVSCSIVPASAATRQGKYFIAVSSGSGMPCGRNFFFWSSWPPVGLAASVDHFRDTGFSVILCDVARPPSALARRQDHRYNRCIPVFRVLISLCGKPRSKFLRRHADSPPFCGEAAPGNGPLYVVAGEGMPPSVNVSPVHKPRPGGELPWASPSRRRTANKERERKEDGKQNTSVTRYQHHSALPLLPARRACAPPGSAIRRAAAAAAAAAALPSFVRRACLCSAVCASGAASPPTPVRLALAEKLNEKMRVSKFFLSPATVQKLSPARLFFNFRPF
ncbi:MAG: hypothetical protein BJ554DRAFT_1349 [Olpidium bornovanus]|uniref:Uncharacterized protein n=1 Tax=Olpidium bornovanus TaxID=278681 RepID=A0A8H7ZS86_9FUNG|nr:MAG: hypothetical protein BJ554DRAFT_1349 [Olpidium bornovanus]